MPKPLPSALPLAPPLQSPPSCLIWHLCLRVLWWNAAPCYSSAGAPRWLRSTSQPCWCCALWPAAARRTSGGAEESKFKGQWLRKEEKRTQLLSLLPAYAWRCTKILTFLLVLPKLMLPFLHHIRQRKVMSVFRHSSRDCVIPDAAFRFYMV